MNTYPGFLVSELFGGSREQDSIEIPEHKPNKGPPLEFQSDPPLHLQ